MNINYSVPIYLIKMYCDFVHKKHVNQIGKLSNFKINHRICFNYLSFILGFVVKYLLHMQKISTSNI